MSASTVETQLRILRLSKQGEGVGEHEGRTVFVPGALPGERVRVRLELSGKVLRATLLELLQPSQDRRTPACGFADRCGGCDWLHLDDGAQVRAKEEIVLSALQHLGQIPRESVTLLPTVPSSKAMGYRRRAVMHFSRGALGFFEKRSHACLAIEACPALTPVLERLPQLLSPHLVPLKSDAESVHLLAAGDKASFAVLLSGPLKPKHQETCERAVRALKLAGAVLVPKAGSAVMVGKPALRVPAPLRPEVPLFLRPDAFSQANEEGNEALVGAALAALDVQQTDEVLELYSGNGNFTFGIAGRARSVLGVESGAVSVDLARRSVDEAKLQNVRFILGDAKRATEGLISEARRFDLLLADPPRAGAPSIASWAQKLRVRRVVYVACDPAALARDASDLERAGFRPKTVQLVDMFPQTHHVEAVMAFEAA